METATGENDQAELLMEALGASRQAIEQHYDVSNEFYRLWLDPSMTYSCALWEPDDSLEQAQVRKMDYHIEQARAAGVGRVLDIGCGWGGMMRRLVTHHGARKAVGLTLSQAQRDWIMSDPHPGIEVFLTSWQSHSPPVPYDAMISVGAFEHFAKVGLSAAAKRRAYSDFFEWAHRHLHDRGRLSLQTIVYENFNERAGNSFVTEIFPESDLPRLAEIVDAAAGLFEVVTVRNDRNHYARTLRMWYQSLRNHRTAIVERFGKDLFVQYEKYLGIFIVGFHTGSVNLSRIVLQRIPALTTSGIGGANLG